jgi:hypothetical protein
MQGETVLASNFGEARNCAITGSLVIAENTFFITDWFCISIRRNQYYDKDICLRFLANKCEQSKSYYRIWVGKFAH